LSAVRVVVADDHPVFRAGLRSLLQSSPGVEVVGEAGDGSQALALASELVPDVLILDIEMAGMNGIEVARRLREAGSPVRVLVLSAYDDEAYILQALAQGAAGYLTKEEAEEVVAEAVRAVARGQEGWLSRSATAKIVRIQREQARAGERLLSDREREVLLLLARGEGNKQIARALRVSANTVKNHLANIYAKLGIHSRVEATLWARDHGLLPPQSPSTRKAQS